MAMGFARASLCHMRTSLSTPALRRPVWSKSCMLTLDRKKTPSLSAAAALLPPSAAPPPPTPVAFAKSAIGFTMRLTRSASFSSCFASVSSSKRFAPLSATSGVKRSLLTAATVKHTRISRGTSLSCTSKVIRPFGPHTQCSARLLPAMCRSARHGVRCGAATLRPPKQSSAMTQTYTSSPSRIPSAFTRSGGTVTLVNSVTSSVTGWFTSQSDNAGDDVGALASQLEKRLALASESCVELLVLWCMCFFSYVGRNRGCSRTLDGIGRRITYRLTSFSFTTQSRM
mmetsp:Transcript_4794/g.15172  ORF Transcript_4794/g.15172 Transcript_4794/m.15172 type:complete len:285 (-) Transcript_4794:86-940(-)